MSVIQTPETVQRISQIKNARQRLGVAKFSYYSLSQGTARAVFDLRNGYVLKLAKNRKGIAQNKQESSPQLAKYYNSLLVPVVAADSSGIWLIQQKAERVTETDWYAFLQSEQGKKFERKVAMLSIMESLNLYDLTTFNNVGKINDTPMVFDYGLSNEGFRTLYANKKTKRS